MGNKYTIYTDGGARGNPGPGAAGIVIEGSDIGKKEFGEFLGSVTNNDAEYKAVILALKKMKHLIGSEKASKAEVQVYVDSEFLERQVNGQYKIKESNLQKLFMDLWNARLDFGKVVISHVRREGNRRADEIVNEVLDREESRLDL